MKRYYTTQQAAQAIAVQLCQLSQDGTQSREETARGWATRIGDAIFKRELIGTRQGIKIDPDKLGSAIAVAVADIRADDLNAWLDSIRCPVRVDEQATPAAKAKAMPAATQNNTDESQYDWKDEAVKLANEIGQKLWDAGQQQITARNICTAVEEELKKDNRSEGQRGPRSAGTIRGEALKGWKFRPKKAE